MKTSVGGTWALRQMRELVSLGVDVHVTLPERAGHWGNYRAAGVKVHHLQTDFPMRQPWLLFNRVSSLRKLVEILQPDIIHSHFVGTTLTMRSALKRHRGCPRIFQVPGPLHLETPVFGRLEIATADNLDYWIGTCQKTCDIYIQCGVPKKRVFLSYYGIDLDKITAPHSKGKLRKIIAASPHTPIVGMVAYMYAPKRYLGHTRGIKGHEDLIDAIAVVRKTYPEVKLVFIGGPWNGAHGYERQIHLYARRKIQNSAIFLGTRHDVFDLYKDFDVVVHPSHSENLGGAGESLLLKIPTIATKVGGFPDIVTPGVTGWLVPAKDPQALSKAISQALADKDKAKEMATTGHQRLLKVLDVKTTADQVKRIYRKVVQNNRHLWG